MKFAKTLKTVGAMMADGENEGEEISQPDSKQTSEPENPTDGAVADENASNTDESEGEVLADYAEQSHSSRREEALVRLNESVRVALSHFDRLHNFKRLNSQAILPGFRDVLEDASAVATETADRYEVEKRGLEKKIVELRDKVESLNAAAMKKEEAAASKQEQKGNVAEAQRIASLEREAREAKEDARKAKEELEDKQSIRHLIDRVGEPARKQLLADSKLLDAFNDNEKREAYIVSIDLRRSTELMLKARTPEHFAKFITVLAKALKEIIVINLGVFDKFTGDGVLAFFPTFYSGESAGLRVIEAAGECHKFFEQHYRDCRDCFQSVLKDVGLGIGIDRGEVNLVQMESELTVVGAPVVYACRLGGANAGDTLVNQPAYEKLLDSFSAFLDFQETEITFKHEGSMVAYKVSRNERMAEAEYPDWIRDGLGLDQHFMCFRCFGTATEIHRFATKFLDLDECEAVEAFKISHIKNGFLLVTYADNKTDMWHQVLELAVECKVSLVTFDCEDADNFQDADIEDV
ncbi:MAG: hypothetical protein NXI22_09935 [bacterium]|nr:hypothetical protein [bacterium]